VKRYEITRDDGSVVRAYSLLDAKHLRGYGVYELLGADGERLYVGRSGRLSVRLRQHSQSKPWWRDVAYLAWTPCGDYAEAVALENMAIATGCGRYNIKGTVDHDVDVARAQLTLPPAAAHRLRGLYAMADTIDGTRLADSYMLALREAGWSLQSIATPLGITRERVRQRIPQAARDLDLIVPSAPKRQPWKRTKKRPNAHLGASEARRMRELHALASRLRGGHGEGHPFRVASVQLTEAIAEARMRDVPRREIAEALNVTVDAITMRLKGHGYLTTAPSMVPFGTPFTQKEACRRGHEMRGDNLRLVNGDPSRRVCRACERIRVSAYRSRRAA
jgi:hypothetical protein